MSEIRWLHLSDLHLGCQGTALWWTVKREFEQSVKEYAGRLGAPHLILITGDLAFKGTEYPLVDQFLGQLLTWLRQVDPGSDPLIVPVPGNHDLVRPEKKKDFPFLVLDSYHLGRANERVKTLIEAVWDKKKPDVSFFKPLFGKYQTWFKKRIAPQFKRTGVTPHLSHFPGDFSLRLDLPGTFPFSIVGLNSAWIQYRAGDDFTERLQLLPEQFHAALSHGSSGGPDLGSFDGKPNLLLTHHPPSWLSRKAHEDFLQLYTPNRFALWLYGHMHDPRAWANAENAGPFRHYFQSPSLFGVEKYGFKDEDRRIGYTWGRMSVDGEIRVWPLKRATPGGDPRFVFENERFAGDDTNGSVLCEGRSPVSGGGVVPLMVATPTIDLTDWLTTLLQQTDHINIQGVSSGAGHVKTGGRHPIEQLYTPLRSRGEFGVISKEEGARGGGAWMLSELLPRHRLLLIEGQPGSGQTTFLRCVASMLARDKLGVSCADGQSWALRYLWPETSVTPQIPAFLRLSRLVSVLEQDKIQEKDDRERLLNLLDKPEGITDETLWKNHWRSLIERGEVVFLLDGLDEVADEKLRDRVFNIFRNACEGWSKCPIVVTSRPIQTIVLRQMNFHAVTIEPFGDGEIREFLDRWVNALFGVEEHARPHEGSEEYRGRLEKAIIDRPSIRRMARSPVMLTCLCVVHWNEGGLPDGRARVYRAVIRWLIAARTDKREKAGFTDTFARQAFALLALRMMGSGEKDRKKVVFDLQDAVEVLEPLIHVEFPLIQRPEDRREKARQWVRFECLGSGIIEEIAANQFRFWHLTFQEFLAALQLAHLGDQDDPIEDWWPTTDRHLDDVQWRETVEILPGCLYDEGGPTRVDLLLTRVLSLWQKPPTFPSEARISGITGRLLEWVLSLWQKPPTLSDTAQVVGIMGRLLSTLDAYGYRPSQTIRQTYQTILGQSMEIFTPAGSYQIDVKTRIEVAEALGRGGDPRLANPRENMIEMPGLAGLSLGKYPVTVEEYGHFVENGGYEEKGHWDDEGWGWRNSKKDRYLPDEWEDQLQAPNRPVVGVSWYEARAYSQWLSEQWEERVRLPTSEEWGMALPKEGEYPWGNEDPTPELANYISGNLGHPSPIWGYSRNVGHPSPIWGYSRNVGHPSPVGVYPLGNGPYGHCDLAGNVWEWCEDVCPDHPNTRMMCGGAWNFFLLSGLLRCAVSPAPTGRYDYIGFRCARSLP